MTPAKSLFPNKATGTPSTLGALFVLLQRNKNDFYLDDLQIFLCSSVAWCLEPQEDFCTMGYRLAPGYFSKSNSETSLTINSL
jgi:hypothetical protein